MVRLGAQRDADVEALLALAQRAWKDVEASVDAMLGSPLDRLATPSWAAQHEAVVRSRCRHGVDPGAHGHGAVLAPTGLDA